MRDGGDDRTDERMGVSSLLPAAPAPLRLIDECRASGETDSCFDLEVQIQGCAAAAVVTYEPNHIDGGG
jgi:hypothetical protein